MLLLSLLLFFTSVSFIRLWATWGELLFPAFCRCWEYSQKWWVSDERDLESFAFCRSPEHWFLRRSFRNMAQKTATDPNTLHTHHLPMFLVHPHQRQTTSAVPIFELCGDLSRWAGSGTEKRVACAHVCKFHEAKAVTLLLSQAAKWFIKQRLQHLCLFVNKSGPCHAKRFF